MPLPKSPKLAIIGGGPAGLMAAEAALSLGIPSELYDAMPSVGRKFLLAGKGGLNLTHSEPLEAFLSRYGARRKALEPMLSAFGPEALREWALGLGIETFVGSSGRVFPAGMKAAPLLRAWLRRLREGGVSFHPRHRWQGFDEEGGLRFAAPEGLRIVRAEATVLALGGGSWARLGSDGAWVLWLSGRGARVEPLRPANCGFDAAWGEFFRERYQGQAVKPVEASFTGPDGIEQRRLGEFIVTRDGVEGSLIYALSATLRDALAAGNPATLLLDLAPGRSLERLVAELSRPRGALSLSNHLKRQAGIGGVKFGLLREILPQVALDDPARLAVGIKSLPLRLLAPRPLDESISSAGGVAFEALDERLMLKTLPGIFCAGEMLDWEAPTGGYLLTACFATGWAAGRGAAAWLAAVGSQRRIG